MAHFIYQYTCCPFLHVIEMNIIEMKIYYRGTSFLNHVELKLKQLQRVPVDKSRRHDIQGRLIDVDLIDLSALSLITDVSYNSFHDKLLRYTIPATNITHTENVLTTTVNTDSC